MPVRHVIRTIDQARSTAAEIGRQWSRFSERGLVVTIEPYRKPHTRSQTAKIHVMLGEMADHLGYDRTEFKEVCKREYWPQKQVQLRKTIVVIPKSTAELTREEASIVIERLLHICAEYNIPIDGEHYDTRTD
jgi:hypothetical protein